MGTGSFVGVPRIRGACSVPGVSVLYFSDERFVDHVAGPGHPEAPERLAAVRRGVTDAGLDDLLVPLVPTPASVDAVERVHDRAYLERLRHICVTGGGLLDQDTGVVPLSHEAAMLAAGAGLDAVAALRDGVGDAAFCAVRPPGHHARPAQAMGFCLVNNVAVTAAALAAAGERVVIVDYDVHHGNGTQEIFWDDDRVGFVSIHQWPLYPGTGDVDEVGGPLAEGSVLNVPVPANATGDVYLMAFDELVVPFVERFGADWVLLSAGFDAHRADPLAGVRLSAGDFGLLTERVVALAPRGRCIAFLEGGYDLEALGRSAAAAIGALGGVVTRPEEPTSGGPGRSVIEVLVEHRR